ncbi:MAG: hypothetical protein ACPGRX_01655 [Bdellovibrionales bacterium]
MKRSLARFLCAVTLFTAAPALANETDGLRALDDLKVSKIGDLELSCGALSHEALNMRDVIFAMEADKNVFKMKSHGVTAAGAVGSLLIGTVTGGVGLAVGGFLLDQNIKGQETHADDIQDKAQQRRTLMMGIYNAKGCEGPLEHAMQNPAKFNPLEKLAAHGGDAYPAELRSGYND